MKRVITGVLFGSVVLSGCTVSPDPISLEEIDSKSQARLEQYTANQEEITRPISLYDAMARAVKYNLDYKVELYEEALRASESDLASLDLLPDLVANAGFANRDSFNGSRSLALINGSTAGALETVPLSTSSDRNIIDSDLTLSWDVLDFGLSYVRAKQAADSVLLANERKRTVANRIIEDVRTAYWRAVSAERLIDKLANLESDIQQALTDSDESYRQRKTPPMAALTYQRELLQIQNEIHTLHNELFVAKRQLAALMNVSPGTSFTLELPERSTQAPSLNLNPEKMVKTALMMRPELRELNYEQRINEKEATTALLELLPSLNFFGGFNHNSNDFLFDNNWLSWGARASWNILEAFKYPATKGRVEAEEELLHQRALALTMAVVTQVHVSAARYEIAKKRLSTMGQYETVSSNILEQVDSGYKARTVSYQNYVRELMNSIVAEARFDIARADLQNSYANIYASIGANSFGDIDASDASVDQLAQHLESHWAKLETALQ